MIRLFTSWRRGEDSDVLLGERASIACLLGDVAGRRYAVSSALNGCACTLAPFGEDGPLYLRMIRFSSLTSRCCHDHNPAEFLMRSVSGGAAGMASSSCRRAAAVLSRTSKERGPPNGLLLGATVLSSGLNMYSFSSCGAEISRFGRFPLHPSSSCDPCPCQDNVRLLWPTMSSARRLILWDGNAPGSFTNVGLQKVAMFRPKRHKKKNTRRSRQFK